MPLDLPPTFIDAVGTPLSATYLNMLRKGAMQVDALTYRIMPTFDSSAGAGTWTPDISPATGRTYPETGNFMMWHGWGIFYTGMTTLTIVAGFTASISETLKVYVNGSGTASATISSGDPTTTNITISGLGFTNGQRFEIRITVEGTRSVDTDAKYVIRDIYTHPLTLSGWPGVPTFGTSFPAANLNQLSSAIQWVYNRVGLIPMVANLGHILSLGSAFGAISDIRTQYFGGVGRFYSNEILRIYGQLLNRGHAAVRFKVYINGVLAHTSSNYGIGIHSLSAPITLSHTVGTRAEVAIYSEVVGGTVNSFTLWSFNAIRSEPDASGYPYAAPPTAFAAGNLAQTTLTTRLNALCTMVNNAKTRIDANPAVWERVRALRFRYEGDGNEDIALTLQWKPVFFRRGSKLLVYGHDVKIMFGAVSIPTDQFGELLLNQYTFTKEEQIIDADNVEQKLVYLDSIDGLRPGMTYYLSGTVYWAAEVL